MTYMCDFHKCTCTIASNQNYDTTHSEKLLIRRRSLAYIYYQYIKIGATNTQREKHQFHIAVILSSVSSGSRGSDIDCIMVRPQYGQSLAIMSSSSD